MKHTPPADPDDCTTPTWIVVGGSRGNQGIHTERPARIALGKFPSLLPIVVTCTNHEDAAQVEAINTLLEQHQIERNNYTALKSLFNSAEIADLLSEYDKFYAFRVGKETGIWVGYDWDKIKHNKSFADAEYRSHPTMQGALLYMIEKFPYNQPKTPKSSPVKSRGPPVGSQGNLSSHALPPSAAPLAPDVDEIIVQLSQHSIEGEKVDPALQALRAVIRPLASQVPTTAGRAAFALGLRADAYLRGRRVNTEDLLKIVRARLYVASAAEFAHYLSVELGWEQSDGEELWSLIQMPGLLALS